MSELDDARQDQAEARRRAAAHAEAEARTPFTSDAERRRVGGLVRAMRAALGAMQTGADPDTTEQTYLLVLDEELESAGVAMREPVEWMPCECGGTGFVAIRSDAMDRDPRLRPCSRCRPVAYGRWLEGHYGADHSCAACESLRPTGRRRSGGPATRVVESGT